MTCSRSSASTASESWALCMSLLTRASIRSSAFWLGRLPSLSRSVSCVRSRFTARSTRAAISPVSSSPTDSESLAPVWDSARRASQRATT
jgi:hypothetical protein